MYGKERIAEMERTLPPADETRAKVRRYRDVSGLSLPQFSALTGYAMPAIRQFLAGTYLQRAGTDVPVRNAIEEAMRQFPVGLPDTDADGKLYETENVADLRQWFLHCHAKRALAFAYGPPGSQKTFVLKHLVADFNRTELARTDATNRAFYLYCSINTRPRDLLAKMCTACGASRGNSIQSCMAAIRVALRNMQAVFVLDEGQHLDIACLEAVRELHDEDPRIAVLLAGSHTLKMLFDRRASELEQWNSRLDAGIELRGVSEDCARGILQAEMPSLTAKQIATFIEGARVTDAYSSSKSTYLNLRRLFKNIEAYRTLRQQKVRAAA